MKKIILPTITLFLATSANATSLGGFDLSAYGFLKASGMYATDALASYNDINLSAPTNAATQTRSQDKTSRMSFQTQQSRIGFNLKKGEQVSSKFEFDFIDFNKSSPTTQMVPRVRIASVTYAWDNKKVIIGQDWDLFSPVTSYTFDYVGLYFLAGNTGFMRQQAQYLVTFGDWELGGALGMAGNNPGTTDNDLELGKSPTYALRASRSLPQGRIGVSGIYSRLTFNQTNSSPTKNTDAYASNAFYEQIHGKFSIKSEAYYGQNLANIGSLSIGKGTATSNAKEYGGHLTATYVVFDNQTLFGGVGVAKIDNRTSLTPFSFDTPSNPNTIKNPGISSNFVSRIGWDYKITPDFSWISELSRYETESKIADSKYQLNIAYGIESGVQLRF